MASEKVVKYCEERFRDGWDYRIRTQDFTDDDIRKAIQYVKPIYWDDLADYLAMLTDDEDVKAHLKGFNSAEERREAIQHIRNLQKRMKEIEEKL